MPSESAIRAVIRHSVQTKFQRCRKDQSDKPSAQHPAKNGLQMQTFFRSRGRKSISTRNFTTQSASSSRAFVGSKRLLLGAISWLNGAMGAHQHGNQSNSAMLFLCKSLKKPFLRAAICSLQVHTEFHFFLSQIRRVQPMKNQRLSSFLSTQSSLLQLGRDLLLRPLILLLPKASEEYS